MKKIIIGTLVSLSIISASCYAGDLTLTKIFEEHIDKMPSVNVQTKSAMCTATANPAVGTSGQNITVTGFVNFTINNATDTAQNYWVDEYMCIVGHGCTHIRNTTSLGPHLSGSGSGTLYDAALLNKGNYQDQSQIMITGESTCNVYGYNSVTVY